MNSVQGLESIELREKEFAQLLADHALATSVPGDSKPVWIHLDGPAGCGKSTVLEAVQRHLASRPNSVWACAAVDGAAAEDTQNGLAHTVLRSLASHAKPAQRTELYSRSVLAAAPALLRQPYLPASFLVLAVLLVLSNPDALSAWGFVLAGIVAAVSLIAAWTGRSAPTRLVRPAIRRFCADRKKRLAILVDNIESLSAGDCVCLLDSVRELTRELPVLVLVAADRRFVRAAFEESHRATHPNTEEPGSSVGDLFLSRYFLLSITIPAKWRALAGGANGVPFPPGSQPLLEGNPRLVARHRFATDVLRAIYESTGTDVNPAAVAGWALLALKWPRLADFLVRHPARISHFRYEQQPSEATGDVAALFADPTVRRLVHPDEEESVLDEETMRRLAAPFPERRVNVA